MSSVSVFWKSKLLKTQPLKPLAKTRRCIVVLYPAKTVTFERLRVFNVNMQANHVVRCIERRVVKVLKVVVLTALNCVEEKRRALYNNELTARCFCIDLPVVHTGHQLNNTGKSRIYIKLLVTLTLDLVYGI